MHTHPIPTQNPNPNQRNPQHFDRAGGGAITADDLREALSEGGGRCADLDAAVADALRSSGCNAGFDADEGAALGFAEFAALMGMGRPGAKHRGAAGCFSRASNSSSVLSIAMAESGRLTSGPSEPCSPSSCADCLTPRVGLKIRTGPQLSPAPAP
jgi:hypothetical protein